jgi:hypothetical protein
LDVRSRFGDKFAYQKCKKKKMGKSNKEMNHQAVLGVGNEWDCKKQQYKGCPFPVSCGRLFLAGFPRLGTGKVFAQQLTESIS